jgi:hypothetical protein
MKKLSLFAAFVLAIVVFNRCAVTKQISEAKTLGDCKYYIASADKITLAGIDIQQFKNMQDFDLSKSPRLALALLSQNVPLNVRLNLDVTNPTKQLAGINQFEYKVLLAENEIFTGFWDQRIDVQPNGGTTRVPMQLTTNAYQLITDAKTRDSFVAMIENLSGKAKTQPTKLVIKLKPTLGIGNSQVNYPGYITIEKEITAKMLAGE